MPVIGRDPRPEGEVDQHRRLGLGRKLLRRGKVCGLRSAAEQRGAGEKRGGEEMAEGGTARHHWAPKRAGGTLPLRRASRSRVARSNCLFCAHAASLCRGAPQTPETRACDVSATKKAAEAAFPQPSRLSRSRKVATGFRKRSCSNKEAERG